VASQVQQSPKGPAAARKARTRVSGSFRPGGTFAAGTGAGPSVDSSLAASTAFVPFQLSSLALLQQQQDGRDQQQQQQQDTGAEFEAWSPGSTSRAQRRPRKAVGAAALAAAADAAGSATGSGARSGRGSPVKTRGLGSPSRGGRNVAAAKGWAR
jgi:hypothetical protein